MFKLVVVINVRPEKAAEFEEIVKPLVENSRKESGCISYDLLPAVNQPNCYLVLETWESDHALEKHNQTMHFRDFAGRINEYATGPMTIYRVEPDKVSLF